MVSCLYVSTLRFQRAARLRSSGNASKGKGPAEMTVTFGTSRHDDDVSDSEVISSMQL